MFAIADAGSASGKLAAKPSAADPMPEFAGAVRPHRSPRYAIVASRWNPRIVDALVAGAVCALREHGVADEAIDIVRVPGAWVIPLASAQIASAGKPVAI